MTEDQKHGWQERIAAGVGERVRDARMTVGMSAQQVADRCTNELGFKLLRTTLANLEAGTRKNVTMGEIVALAAALDTSPLQLLYPIESAEQVEYLPGQHVSPWEAWQRFTAPLPPSIFSTPEPYDDQPARERLLVSLAFLTQNQSAWRLLRQQQKDRRFPAETRANLAKSEQEVVVDSIHELEELEDRRIPLDAFDPEWIDAVRESLRWAQEETNRLEGDDA